MGFRIFKKNELKEYKEKFKKDQEFELYGRIFFPKNISPKDAQEADRFISFIIEFIAYVKLDQDKSIFVLNKSKLLNSSQIQERIENLVMLLNNLAAYLFEVNERKYIEVNVTKNIYLKKGFSFSDFPPNKSISKKSSFIGSLNFLSIEILQLSQENNIIFTEPLFPMFNYIGLTSLSSSPIIGQRKSVLIAPPIPPRRILPISSKEDDIYELLPFQKPQIKSSLGTSLTIQSVFSKHSFDLKALQDKAKLIHSGHSIGNYKIPSKILVCCTGNHTRSPVAEALLHSILKNCCLYPSIYVYSAGLGKLSENHSGQKFRQTFSADTRNDGRGTKTANINSIKVIKELCDFTKNNSNYFENADSKINGHVARDIENVSFTTSGQKIIYDLYIVMEEGHRETLNFWKQDSDRAKVLFNKIKLRIRKLADAKFVIENQKGVSEGIYDPQKDFNLLGANNSYPHFVKMLDEVLGDCIKWAKIIQSGTWDVSIENKVGHVQQALASAAFRG